MSTSTPNKACLRIFLINKSNNFLSIFEILYSKSVLFWKILYNFILGLVKIWFIDAMERKGLCNNNYCSTRETAF